MLLCAAGVLNGIDMQEWNPEADTKIYQTYSAADLKKGKTANKLALQKELSLAERPDVRRCCSRPSTHGSLSTLALILTTLS